MTPFQMEMLLHYYYSPEPFPRADTSAGVDALEYFRAENLIKEMPEEGEIRLSDRGLAYVEFLRSLPLPVANWTIPGPWNPSLPNGVRLDA